MKKNADVTLEQLCFCMIPFYSLPLKLKEVKRMNDFESQYPNLAQSEYIINHKQRGKIVYIMLYFILSCIDFCQDCDILFLLII